MLAFLSGAASAAVRMIGDEEVRDVATQMCSLGSRLAQVVQTIDFYRSTATVTTFDGNRWFTVGVSPNIVDASFQALIDSVRYKLVRDGATAT